MSKVKRGKGSSGLLALATAATVFAAGCGDDGVGPDGDGPFTANFTATISGVVSRSYSGIAVFGSGTDPDTGESAWVLYLATDPDNPQASSDVIYFLGTGTPSEGTKTLLNLDTNSSDLPANAVLGLVVFTDSSSGLFGSFGSLGGQLTLSRVSTDRLDGSFAFTAAGSLVEGQAVTDGEITVQGSFEAQGGQFFVPIG